MEQQESKQSLEDVVKDCVKGIIILLKYMASIDEYPVNFGSIVNSYSGKISTEASDYVFEFAKDGITKSLIDYVNSPEAEAENYLLIWNMANGYLPRFRYPVVDPQPVNLA